LLLDQAFLAGLGNYLRVEILWQVGLSGRHNASALDDKQLDALAHALLDIPRLSYRTRGAVDENKHHGALFRFNVFHRDGEICERCGGIIEKTMLRRDRFTGVRDASISDTLRFLSYRAVSCRAFTGRLTNPAGVAVV
jgi:formamidopyrimidine-DNA glycosylase